MRLASLSRKSQSWIICRAVHRHDMTRLCKLTLAFHMFVDMNSQLSGNSAIDFFSSSVFWGNFPCLNSCDISAEKCLWIPLVDNKNMIFVERMTTCGWYRALEKFDLAGRKHQNERHDWIERWKKSFPQSFQWSAVKLIHDSLWIRMRTEKNVLEWKNNFLSSFSQQNYKIIFRGWREWKLKACWF